MTDEEANYILMNSDWAKFSDARDLLQTVYWDGYKRAKEDITEKLINLRVESSVIEASIK